MAREKPTEVLAIIPARGGSVKVANKNILELAGKPVICHTIEHARASETVTRTVVSTDSEQIAAIARECGCEVIMRPAELATDTARIDHALRHVFDTLLEREGYRPEVVVLLYANVPVRDGGITDRCVRHLQTEGGTSVRSFCDVGKFHPLWMSRLEGDRDVPFQELTAFRRQDLPKLYVHDGACVAIRAEILDASRHRLDDNFGFMGDDRRGIVQERHLTIEIDTPYDLLLAETLLGGKSRKKGQKEGFGAQLTDGNE